MEWNDRYATGIEHLDHQHRMLFQMESDFRHALDEGGGERVYEEFLRSLEMYSRIHFGAEETCMHRFRCPAAAANLEGHQAFRDLLDEAQGRLMVGGYRREDASSLVERVRHWLMTHIGRIDVQLRPLVEGP